MIVRLTNTDSITLDLPVQYVRWTVLSTRQFGEAQFTIPPDSPALAAAYLDEDGGSLVEISHPSLPFWQGICVRPRIGRGGVVVNAQHIAGLTNRLPVSLSRTFTAMTAGGIAYAAVQSAVTGLGRAVLRLGTFVEAAPVIDSYTFTGQPLAQVLGDLAERSGQEWTISDDGAISWVPRQGSLYSRWLCDAGDLAGGERESDVTERTTAVSVRDAQGREQTITMPDRAAASFWQRRDVVSAGTTSAALAGLLGLQQLTSRRGSTVKLTFRLKRHPGG